MTDDDLPAVTDATPLPFCRGCGRAEGECDCGEPADVGQPGVCLCGAPTIDGCRWCPACSELGGEG